MGLDFLSGQEQATPLLGKYDAFRRHWVQMMRSHFVSTGASFALEFTP